METYLYLQIIRGALDYKFILNKFPQFKVGVDEKLVKGGYEYLIVPLNDEE